MIDETFDRHVAAGRAAKFAAAALPAGHERTRLFTAAARDYAAAGEAALSTYALINAATLDRLSGDDARARDRCKSILAMLDSGRHAPDTPYWLAATRAEALLILGEEERARGLLARAIETAPQAWEDHAITLRQFRLLAADGAADAAWLDAFRPPRVMYYAGLIGIASDDISARAAIHRAIAEAAPCMAYGALAAGTDILAAEALIAAGTELHVVLPAGSEMFRAKSVEPCDAGWPARFDRCLAQAASVTVLPGSGELTGDAVAMAGEIAMGLAIGKAAELETRAIALRTFAPRNMASPMAHLWDRWRAAGLTVNALPLERSATARPLPIGKGLRGQVLLAVADGPVRREVHASMALALAAAHRHGGHPMALDYVLASGEPDGEAWAFADAALAAADRPSLRASGCALAAARLACPQLSGEVVGSVRHRRGQTDVYAVRLPEAES